MLEVAQCFEAGSLELADPAVVDFLQRHGVEKMQLLSPAPLYGDEVCSFEQRKVLRHTLPCHVEVLAQLAQRLPVVRVQAVQELSSRLRLFTPASPVTPRAGRIPCTQ